MNQLIRSVSFFLLMLVLSCQAKQEDFDRHPAQLHYSRHARCRMACRHISESEVQEILEKGSINYSKSESGSDPCHRKYALEGVTRSNHQLRIIFAPCNGKMTVVTCIDLGVEWECHCN